jgi:CBS domain-containing protein
LATFPEQKGHPVQYVKDIMTRDVHYVRPDSTVREAAAQMRDFEVGCLPVIDSERVVGLLTDRDIAIRAVAEGRGPDEVTCAEAMSSKPVTIGQDQPVADAAALMRRRAIRRLIATDERGRPIGIVSLGDLAAATEDRETERAAEKVFHSPCVAAAHEPGEQAKVR